MITKKYSLTVIATTLLFSFTNAQEVETSSFPSEITLEQPDENTKEQSGKASELTVEQKEEANKNIKKATNIYNDIIDSQAGSRLKTVEKNLEFLDKALAQTRKELKLCNDKLDKMKLEVLSRSKVVDKLDIKQELKDRKKRELHLLFEEKKEYLSFSIENYNNRIKKMSERKILLEDEREVFIAETALNKEKNKKDTWSDIDKKRTEEADKAFQKLNKEQIEKRYQELEK